MKEIRSRENPLIKFLNKLASSSRERKSSGLTLLDGEHLIESLADAGGAAEILAISPTALKIPGNAALLERIPSNERLLIPETLLAAISHLAAPTGFLAVVKVPTAEEYPSVAETCLLLDGIQDPGNLGTMLRTAVGAGLRHVFMSPGSAMAWSPKVLRAGMGAHFHLSLHENADLRVIAATPGLTAVATAAQAPDSIFDADLRRPLAWLFGAEGAGLSEPLKSTAQLLLSIPLSGPVESLNVASAAAICLYEQLRQKNSSGTR